MLELVALWVRPAQPHEALEFASVANRLVRVSRRNQVSRI
jgi:hypothetical protein